MKININGVSYDTAAMTAEQLAVAGICLDDYTPEDSPLNTLPTADERIAFLEESNSMLTECILEMSAMLYA